LIGSFINHLVGYAKYTDEIIH